MDRIAGIILAGGRSTRMGGGDKGLRLLSGRTMLRHVIDRLRPQVEAMAINANGDPARFAVFDLPVLPDPLPDLGPLGGVLAGLSWAAERESSHIATVACDTPFFPPDFVERLQLAAAGTDRIVQSASGGRTHPTFALWPVSVAEDLEGFLRREGPSSVRAFAGDRHAAMLVDFPIDGGLDPFFNINTRDDLEKAERIAAEA